MFDSVKENLRLKLARTGVHDEARHAYEIAIGLERDPAVRRFLQRRQSLLVIKWAIF
jgi:predicted RNA polymerase sigma factor